MPEPTRYARCPDGSLVAYRTAGSGPLDLVFSVGISNCEALWDHPASARFLDRLATFSRLIVFDFRGSGISDPLRTLGLPTWEDWTQDLLAVLDHVGSAHCALFVTGTAIPSALMFATTYPERTSALALYQLVGEPVDPAFAEGAADFIESGWGTLEFARERATSRADDDRFVEWVARTQRLSATPRMAAAFVRNSMTFDARDLLGLVHAPSLVLHRQGPFTVDPTDAASLIADARVVDLQTSDDLLFGTETGERVADLIEEFLTGARPTRQPDRVLATVLFTDIVGSTETAAAMGDREWRRLLDRHDRLVREGVERAAGRVVKTTGDGALATFEGPGRAIECAKAVRASLAQADIAITAGLHTGEVELRSDDVGGIAVHIGARVAAQAGAGEILVSSTVKDLVVGSDFRFEERGSHVLRGVPGEWSLYAVVD